MGVTPRQVQIICKEYQIEGATRISRILIIPECAKKPTNDKRAQRETGGNNDAPKHYK